MTKTMKVANIQAQKVQDTKADIDSRIKMLMELDEQIKALKKQYDDAKVEFESTYYELPASEGEVVEGNEYMATKTPVLTKKEYDTKRLAIILTNAGVDASDIIKRKMVTTVDEKELGKLQKSGKVAADLVNQVISGNQSYRTKMEHKA